MNLSLPFPASLRPGLAVALLLLLALAGLPPLAAGDDDWQELHERVSRGELVPMATVLDWLEARYAGQVLEVELEREDSRLVYEVEMLGPRGQRVEFAFDAASGELIGIEGVGIDDMRRRP
ncbi:putative membrane protein YkoI [Halomonas campaniensis]|uniref:Putative membrane protein YkoI n=1 Tax=Halomonas campaniensis TaxID=213554 RepID=A0A7W5K0C5_9GAMM|nr:PepSY domain-containing protein [Halomonas campaniensis]MBB3329609.1 putative membrane protein YkoI [Halomonas campaniensis]